MRDLVAVFATELIVPSNSSTPMRHRDPDHRVHHRIYLGGLLSPRALEQREHPHGAQHTRALVAFCAYCQCKQHCQEIGESTFQLHKFWG